MSAVKTFFLLALCLGANPLKSEVVLLTDNRSLQGTIPLQYNSTLTPATPFGVFNETLQVPIDPKYRMSAGITQNSFITPDVISAAGSWLIDASQPQDAFVPLDQEISVDLRTTFLTSFQVSTSTPYALSGYFDEGYSGGLIMTITGQNSGTIANWGPYWQSLSPNALSKTGTLAADIYTVSISANPWMTNYRTDVRAGRYTMTLAFGVPDTGATLGLMLGSFCLIAMLQVRRDLRK